MVHQSCGCVVETSDNSASPLMQYTPTFGIWFVHTGLVACWKQSKLPWFGQLGIRWHQHLTHVDAIDFSSNGCSIILFKYVCLCLCLYWSLLKSIEVYWSLDDCSNPHWGNPVAVFKQETNELLSAISWKILDFWWGSWRVRLSVRFLVISAVDWVYKLLCELRL